MATGPVKVMQDNWHEPALRLMTLARLGDRAIKMMQDNWHEPALRMVTLGELGGWAVKADSKPVNN